MLYKLQAEKGKDVWFFLADDTDSVMVKGGEAALLVEWNPRGPKSPIGTIGTAILMLSDGQLIRTASINHPEQCWTGPLDDIVWNPVAIGG